MRDLKIFVVLLVGVAAITTMDLGCGTLKDIGRTVNDAASILCNVFAVEMQDADPDLLGSLSPADYCAIQDNLSPFIDQALAAKNAAGQLSVARAREITPEPTADAGAP